MKRQHRFPVVCSIGSTDPTAGAGLFLDAAVYARLRDVVPVFVVAGVTAQNSRRVSGVVSLPNRSIVRQLDAIWEHVRPDAVRIGLIPSVSACRLIARYIRALRQPPPVVVDPVIAATSGARLIADDALDGLRALIRIATVVTPNAYEAGALTGVPVRTLDDAERAALALATRAGAALVTGGHVRAGDSIVDVLASGARVTRYRSTRIDRDARGTGCMLASVIAASLARGDSLDRAVRRARRFVRFAIAHARPLERGRAQFIAAGVGVPPV